MAGLENNLYISTAVTWVAAFVALVMRVIARRMTKMPWWYDDWFCVAAFIFASLYSATILEWTMHWSLGQYMPDTISTEAREEIMYNSRFIGFFNSLTYAFSIAASKLAILCLYWRIFKISIIRIPIQVLIALSVAWIILRTFMLLFRCIPIQYYWDKSITGSCKISDTQFFFGTVFTHFLMDIAILILPVLEVFRLRLRLGQKLAISALFVIGTIVCLASVGAIYEALSYDPKSTQMPHDYGMYCVWGSVELNMAIVSACFPLLRPIFSLILPSRFLSSIGSSAPISRPSNAIRLTTLSRTNKEKESDETSSTHQLADSENGLRDPSDFDPINVHGSEGVNTIISSRYHNSREENYTMAGSGIHVRNDMVVQVEEIEMNKAYGR
ncbi:hypothetical protein B0J13DRAFT_670219 [Dactylonectria estremocensis]|uniref:Rhodopsin domain-containing protein n=1 Tax=Dactylonectria estremocensis TaxID=1079267 RepID=A0A9P9FCT9_9HYPO|nr:hypothetical protein B0J13DRAFT_670219 [Dactylonectria estremocensis]